YYRTDPHWTGRGCAIAARLIAERLKRYSFVRTAGAGPRRYTVRDRELIFQGVFGSWLTPEERSEAVSRYTVPQVLGKDDVPYAALPGSAVLIVGDSFTNYGEVPGGTIDALLAAELNMPVSKSFIQGSSVDTIKEFVRDSDLRKNTRVAIWVISMVTLG